MIAINDARCLGPGIVLLALGTLSTAARANAPPTPNVVVVMADDLEVAAVDALLAAGLLPNLEQYFVQEGMKFQNAYVSNSLCCPSRATFLTGQYTHNHGVLTNQEGSGGSIAAFDDSSTIATWMQAAGYRTGYVGKYLNGYGELTAQSYVPPGWDDWQVLVEPLVLQMYGYALNSNGTVLRFGDDFFDEIPEHYQTDVIAKRAARFIRDADANDEQPFFLTVMPVAPHTERWTDPISPGDNDYTFNWLQTIRAAPRHLGLVTLQLPMPFSFNEIDMSDKPQWARRNRPSLSTSDIDALAIQYRARLGSLLAVDDLLGTIISVLDARGELDDTVVIFTSDNGHMSGQHRMSGKLVPYEESIRVPFYLRGPHVAAKVTAGQVVLNNDLAPTIADLGDATIPYDPDGRSLWPIVEDPVGAPARLRFLIEHYRASRTEHDLPDYTAVRSSVASDLNPVQLYVEYTHPDGGIADTEFYDLLIDPQQLNSRHDDLSYGVEIDTLAFLLSQLRNCSGGNCAFWEGGILQ